MIPRRSRRDSMVLVLGLVALVVLVAACVPSSGPAGSGGASPVPHPPLVPASPGADPVSLLAWVFTPVFQVLFLLLALFDKFTGDVGIAIILVTLIIRTALVPVFRKQIVSTRRVQLLQPELRELQKRYKGDRARMSQAQMELYKDRGVNPASGCLPLLLQLPLLMIVYSVISQGLTNPDPTAMFSVFGTKLLDVQCVNGLGTPAQDLFKPCLDTSVWWLGGLDVGKPAILFSMPLIGGFSLLALLSAFLQLIQSRMTMPPADPSFQDSSSRMQRQLVLFLPLISIVYGGFLPAGLFIYWIVTTVFSIAQQYLIVGWGAMFPLLGWDPAFAKEHKPRFPVEIPTHQATTGPSTPGRSTSRPTTPANRAASAAATVRPRERGRQGRRGRKR